MIPGIPTGQRRPERSISTPWLALLCLLALPPATALGGSCTLARLGSVDFTIVDGELVVPVTVSGRRARMRVEVASSHSRIDGEYVQPFGMKTRYFPGFTVVRVGDKRITQEAALTDFAVGPLRVAKAEFLLIPSDRAPGSDSEPVIGTLAMDVLGHLDFELDFANNRLNFYAQDHCPGGVVYWTNRYSSAALTRGPSGNFYFPLELEGKKVEASISTTSSGASLPTEVTRRLYGFDETSPGVESTTDQDGHTVAHYRAMSISGDGLSVKNARIELRTTKSHEVPCSLTTMQGPARYEGCLGGEAPLLIGLDVVRHLHLYFATKERVLYFSDATASK